MKPCLGAENPEPELEPVALLDPVGDGQIAYPPLDMAIPDWEVQTGRYVVRFARDQAELLSIQRLRFRVFNLELGSISSGSFELGVDSDEFDATCHHLVALERATGDPVATCRLQTAELARLGVGFYSAREFDLRPLPAEIEGRGAELGRVCIEKSHRRRRLLELLWRGIGAYMLHNGKRYLFGCSSIATRDPACAWATATELAAQGRGHPTLCLRPMPRFAVPGAPSSPATSAPIPALFRAYFAMGARVCSEPALDSEFATADFFLLFDLERLDVAKRNHYAG